MSIFSKFRAACSVTRLKEPSTWRGIIMVLTSLGVTISPENIEIIVSAGTAAAGVIGIFCRDNNIKKD